MATSTVNLRILTPEEVFYSNEVEMVIVEGMLGKEGYMAGHTPAMKLLKEGIVEIKEPGAAEKKRVRIAAGYISVDNGILIFTAEAKWA